MKKKILSLAAALSLALALIPASMPSFAAEALPFGDTVAGIGNSWRAPDAFLWIRPDGTLWVYEDGKATQFMTDVCSVSSEYGLAYILKQDGSLWLFSDGYFFDEWGNFSRQAYDLYDPYDNSIFDYTLYKIADTVVLARFPYFIKADGSVWELGGYSISGSSVDGMFIRWGDGNEVMLEEPDPTPSDYNGGGVSSEMGAPPTRLQTSVVDVTDLFVMSEDVGCVLITASDSVYYYNHLVLSNVMSIFYRDWECYLRQNDGSVWRLIINRYDDPDNPIDLIKMTGDIKPEETSFTELRFADLTRVNRTDGKLTVYSYEWGNNGVELKELLFTDTAALPGAYPAPVNPLDSATDWAKAAITSAIGKGFVPTDLQGDYKSTITRGEFCRMAIMYIEHVTGKNIDSYLTDKGVERNPYAFTDTSDPYILAAYALGVTTGTGNNQFTPNGPFTRAAAAGMIKNVCAALGRDVGGSPPAGFADADKISVWTADGVNYCVAQGIMSGGSGNLFNPQNPFTREMSIMTFDNMKPETLTKR